MKYKDAGNARRHNISRILSRSRQISLAFERRKFLKATFFVGFFVIIDFFFGQPFFFELFLFFETFFFLGEFFFIALHLLSGLRAVIL